jgi:hypothetical protein
MALSTNKKLIIAVCFVIFIISIVLLILVFTKWDNRTVLKEELKILTNDTGSVDDIYKKYEKLYNEKIDNIHKEVDKTKYNFVEGRNLAFNKALGEFEKSPQNTDTDKKIKEIIDKGESNTTYGILCMFGIVGSIAGIGVVLTVD